MGCAMGSGSDWSGHHGRPGDDRLAARRHAVEAAVDATVAAGRDQPAAVQLGAACPSGYLRGTTYYLEDFDRGVARHRARAWSTTR